MTPTARKRSPLESLHHRLGARLVDFAGWSMPLQYDGVIAEHEAVRTAAGVFDVSHLGKLRIQGLDGGQALQRALTCDVLALDPGRARYGLALADDGGTLDDLFVYRLEKEWLVVPNAANVDVVAGSIRECGGSPVDEWQQWAIIALQGPRSFDLFKAVFSGSQATAL
ncbi:MAG TPA: hypothetical protein VE975_06930, partial [Actinomycetota bacterium]|nr:hypothetical protein [Actinomycetota bacterium]